MNYLLDTCIVLELRRRCPDPRITAWLDEIPDEELFISVVTLATTQIKVERLFAKNQKKAAKIENWLNLVAATPRVIPVDDEIIRLAARWQFENPEIDDSTTLIAATAAAGGLMLVTRYPERCAPLGIIGFNPFLIDSEFFSKR